MNDLSNTMQSSVLNQGIIDLSIPKDKPQRPSLAELKNGKVNFKQKCISLEKLSETLQEIVQFRDMLEKRMEKHEQPLESIPVEHWPVIAKLGHESDKNLLSLAKYIQHELLPAQDEDDEIVSSSVSSALPLSAVEIAIKQTMIRNNYGIVASHGGSKIPAGLCVWRWEVKDDYRKWLPKNAREKVDARRAERLQAQKDLIAIVESLPQGERDAILGSKGIKPPKDPKSSISPSSCLIVNCAADASKTSPKSSPKLTTAIRDEENNNQLMNTSSKMRQPVKVTDPEKAAKDKERAERRLAKVGKEEKEKEARLKSQSIMASFFGKSKTSQTPPIKETEVAIAGPSQSDFERAFKPFVLKKDAQLAPVNWFLTRKRSKWSSSSGTTQADVILIDEDFPVKTEDSDMGGIQELETNVSHMGATKLLDSALSSLPRPVAASLRPPGSARFKTHYPHSIRDIVSELSEAEITGDDSLVRVLLGKLRNRAMFPTKAFSFSEDARPGYFGTWTRSSRLIGARSPFARDVAVVDYGYDSGEEWEEEAPGEADDVVEDGEEEDVDPDDADSDLDSWLVDDDEVEEVGAASEERPPTLPPTGASAPQATPKRKADEEQGKLGKKRKVVVPLVPFAKGPCWERNIGQCEHDAFKPYRIHLFNDTPFPIDPFTFVSTAQQEQRQAAKELSKPDTVFAVPHVPSRLGNPPTGSSFSTLKSATVVAGPAVKRTASAPKTPFPDAHLPFLLGKIASLSTGNITFLVESIYQDLRVHSVKKNAIEAKVREVGEKCKERKVWAVKRDVAVGVPSFNTQNLVDESNAVPLQI